MKMMMQMTLLNSHASGLYNPAIGKMSYDSACMMDILYQLTNVPRGLFIQFEKYLEPVG